MHCSLIEKRRRLEGSAAAHRKKFSSCASSAPRRGHHRPPPSLFSLFSLLAGKPPRTEHRLLDGQQPNLLLSASSSPSPTASRRFRSLSPLLRHTSAAGLALPPATGTHSCLLLSAAAQPEGFFAFLFPPLPRTKRGTSTPLSRRLPPLLSLLHAGLAPEPSCRLLQPPLPPPAASVASCGQRRCLQWPALSPVIVTVAAASSGGIIADSGFSTVDSDGYIVVVPFAFGIDPIQRSASGHRLCFRLSSRGFGAVVNVAKPPKDQLWLFSGAIISWASRDLKFL
ncbi:hypothetical protein ZIOFF_023827 [Zingiber officinale]|uniref:Uncharacterized protein n=1 Tax=Zingiber officinale TaxID=94328 RepID=A0A8J5LFS1_ZINOF|nr:hypothetical protein ZIOFF_023827 [Zingiber officinale]